MARNITLKVDETLLAAARGYAKADNTSVNEQFGLWLEAYIVEHKRKENHAKAMEAMRNIRGYFKLDKMPTRDEMNARR